MKRSNRIYLVLLAILFFLSLISPVSKIFFQDSSLIDQAKELQNELSDIESTLDGTSIGADERSDFKGEILEIRRKTDQITSREAEKNRLHWWTDILLPAVLLFVVIYHSVSDRRTDKTAIASLITL